MKLNKKLLDIFKIEKTTSDEYTYTCDYINDIEDALDNYIDGSHIVYDQLLDNAVEVINSGSSATGNLNKSVGDYDMLIVLVRGDWNHLRTLVIPKGLQGYAYDCYLFSDTQYYFSGSVNFPSNTTVKIAKTSGSFSATIMQVYGIKFK